MGCGASVHSDLAGGGEVGGVPTGSKHKHPSKASALTKSLSPASLVKKPHSKEGYPCYVMPIAEVLKLE